MKEFTGKVAVVTGAASGIGRALAERCAAAGMKVVLADIEDSTLTKTAREMQEQGATVLGVLTDVSKAGAMETLAQKTLQVYGAVHILCNNAGVAGDFVALWEQTIENWEWVLGVNLWGVIHGIRTFVPIMLDQHTEGHVVNTASMAGLLSLPFIAVYHATKHAVVTLSEALHYELALRRAQVKVSVLCPGFVNTRIMESERNRPGPLHLQGQPQEMEQTWVDAYREFVATGLPPAEVAERVFNAIRDEKFYVFPHPEFLDLARARMETILEQRNPTLDFVPDAMKQRLHI
jgi:NAD(P)-dependent dehydrogenase (short-subunit alcohol dehydrogenase family)